jgi:hypothetical protein
MRERPSALTKRRQLFVFLRMGRPRVRGAAFGEPTADCCLVLVDNNGIAIYVADIHYHRSCFALRFDLLARSKSRVKA